MQNLIVFNSESACFFRDSNFVNVLKTQTNCYVIALH